MAAQDRNINPLVRCREQVAGWRGGWSIRLGLSYHTVAPAELGYFRALPPGVRKALVAEGVDADALGAEYTAWRKAKGATE